MSKYSNYSLAKQKSDLAKDPCNTSSSFLEINSLLSRNFMHTSITHPFIELFCFVLQIITLSDLHDSLVTQPLTCITASVSNLKPFFLVFFNWSLPKNKVIDSHGRGKQGSGVRMITTLRRIRSWWCTVSNAYSGIQTKILCSIWVWGVHFDQCSQEKKNIFPFGHQWTWKKLVQSCKKWHFI